MRLTALLARAAHRLLRDYQLNWIYAAPARPVAPAMDGLRLRPMQPSDLAVAERSADIQVRKLLGYPGSGAQGLVLADGRGEPLCVAHFVDRARYGYPEVWPLGEDQLALIDIVTLPEARGRGHAARLIGASTRALLGEGGRTGAICFIWWNHRASIRAFRRAGWRPIGFSARIVTHANRARQFRLRLRA